VPAHLGLSDHPHAAAASSVRRFEDDGEAVRLGEDLRVLRAGDGGVGSWDHRYTWAERGSGAKETRVRNLSGG